GLQVSLGLIPPDGTMEAVGRADPSCMTNPTSSPRIGPAGDLQARLKAACATCNLRELCVPGGVSPCDLDRLDTLVATRRRVRRGESLFRAGDGFDSIYAVRSGFFKTRVTS